MAELKPCPFCGNKPRLIEKDPFGQFRKELNVFGVYCDCGAVIWKCSEEDAREAWNRRVENGS